MAALRIALREVVTRDYLRSELRDLLQELDAIGTRDADSTGSTATESAATAHE